MGQDPRVIKPDPLGDGTNGGPATEVDRFATCLRPWKQPPATPATLFVTTAGDDETGDGTVGDPYLTIERALLDVGDNNGPLTTVDVGAGTFPLPTTLLMPSFVQVQGVESDGATATQVGAAISGTTARLEVDVTGLTTTSVDELAGEFIEWTSGPTGRRGIIRRCDITGTTAPGVTRVVVTQNNPVSLSVPVDTDAFKIVNLDTTVEWVGALVVAIVGAPVVIFQGLRFDASVFLQFTGSSTVTCRRCRFDVRRIEAPHGDVELTTCYVHNTGDSSAGVLSVNGGRIGLGLGTVIDCKDIGAASAWISVARSGHLQYSGQVFFRDLGDLGLRLHNGRVDVNGNAISGGIVPGATTMTWDSCMGGVRINDPAGASDGVGGSYRFPELFHDTAALTRDHAVEAEEGAYVRIEATSSIDSALGTNLVSADGGASNVAMDADTTIIFGGSPTPGGFASAAALTIVLPLTVPDTDTPGMVAHGVSSRFDVRVAAGTVDGGPTTQNHVNPLRSFIAVDITTLTTPGTLRLTGDSYDPATGNVSVADTEDLVISSTGFISSTKRWDGAVTVVLSSVGGLDVVLDSFAFSPLGGALAPLTINAIEYSGSTSNASNSVRVLFEKYEDGAGLTTLFDVTLTNQPNGVPWSNLRTALGVEVAADEDVILEITTQRILDLHVNITGTQDNA